MGNATGLFNMLRNIGGSIGIAMATTAIIRRAALHQTEIGANLSPSSPVLQQKSRRSPHTSATISALRRAPRIVGLHLWHAAAAVGTARLRGRLPLDSAACLLLRRSRVALQQAIKARRPASRRTLISLSSLACAHLTSCCQNCEALIAIHSDLRLTESRI